MKRCLIIHYHEIGLKGKNRGFFEGKLEENLKKALSSLPGPPLLEIKKLTGRHLIRLEGNYDESLVAKRINTVFGVANYSFAYETDAEIEKLQEVALNLVNQRKYNSFRVETQRSDKSLPWTSVEVNQKVGAYLLKNTDIPVNLTNPELTCFIELVTGKAYLYLEKLKGAGGLPLSSGGRAVGLLSGGIDSPVACFQVMRRGVRIVFLHFHSYPYTDKASIDKARELVQILTSYQFKSRLYLLPFIDIQKEIIVKTPEKLRVILYRRMMLRIAAKIAQTEKAQAIVTGESLGQVASQTIENLRAIEAVTELPILRPLIGTDKQDIIAQAEAMGTYQTSIMPYQDCCAFFVPKHPETKANLEELQDAEAKLENLEEMIEQAVRNASIETFSAYS